MNNHNTKIYLIISGALILLFILIIIIPLANKSTNPTTNKQINAPTPTSVDYSQSNLSTTDQVTTSEFTGVVEEDLPSNITDLAEQKKALRLQTPIQLSLFTIDFDYAEDKFIVTLSEPKDQARTDFNSWKSSTYPALTNDQFNFK